MIYFHGIGETLIEL